MYLVQQGDGNLVVYTCDNFVPRNAIWAAGCHGKGRRPYNLSVQNDGNLVVYDGTGTAIWAGNTWGVGRPPFMAVLENDGAFVLFDKNHTKMWSSK